jgi:hypothetical protein
MAKATRKNITKAKSKTSPRKGLALISAGNLRKKATPPDLKGELRLLRHPEDVEALTVLYDAYRAAADAILGIENQPRAQGTEHLLEAEWNQMVMKSWIIAEHMKGLRPTRHSQDAYVRVLVDCIFQMGADVNEAWSVMQAARAVATDNSADDWSPPAS